MDLIQRCSWPSAYEKPFGSKAFHRLGNGDDSEVEISVVSRGGTLGVSVLFVVSFDAVGLLFQVFVVEFEVGEFELERVVLSFEAFGSRYYSVVFRPRDNVVVAGDERQREESEGQVFDESAHSVRSLSSCRRPMRCLSGIPRPDACSRRQRSPPASMWDAGRSPSLPTVAHPACCRRQRTVQEARGVILGVCVSFVKIKCSLSMAKT